MIAKELQLLSPKQECLRGGDRGGVGGKVASACRPEKREGGQEPGSRYHGLRIPLKI